MSTKTIIYLMAWTYKRPTTEAERVEAKTKHKQTTEVQNISPFPLLLGFFHRDFKSYGQVSTRWQYFFIKAQI